MNVKVELWSLIGPYWRLPIRVVWNDTLAEVRVGAGARLTQRMIREADEFLASVGTQKGTTFWVYRTNLEKIAQLFPGEDPDDAVEWAPLRAKAKLPPADFKPSEFITEYCRHEVAWIRDPMFADAAWESFCKFMLHWLLNEHRTVDLMFATLDAFCLRKNWAGATAKYEWEKGKKGKMMPGSLFNPDVQDMVKRGVAHYLVTRSVTAFDRKTRLLRYTLECQTTEIWDEMMTRIERAKHRTRDGNYMRSFTSQARRQLVRVLNAYAHFLQEAARPNADVPERNPSGFKGKPTPNYGSRTARRAGAPWIPNVVVPVPESAAGEMAGADAGVSSVPDLQSEGENVRDARDESIPGS